MATTAEWRKWNAVRTKQITNSDRFRAMADDSIADFLNGVETEGRAYGPKGKAAWLEWLKQEVNVE